MSNFFNENIDNRHKHEIARLSKFLTLILRHRPEIVDAILNEDGWTNISIEEIAAKIAKQEGFSWVTVEDIIDVVESDPKDRYQISNDANRRIRATYGHSALLSGILENPDKPANLPSIAFYGCSNNQLGSILRLGLTPTNRGLVHLSVEKNDALAIARKRNPRFARIAQINVNAAAQSGIKFKLVTPRVVVCEEVPPQFLTGIPVPRKMNFPEQKHRTFRNSRQIGKRTQKEYPSHNYHDKDKKKEEPPNQKQKPRSVSNYKSKRSTPRNSEEIEITDEDFDFEIKEDDSDELTFDNDDDFD